MAEPIIDESRSEFYSITVSSLGYDDIPKPNRNRNEIAKIANVGRQTSKHCHRWPCAFPITCSSPSRVVSELWCRHCDNAKETHYDVSIRNDSNFLIRMVAAIGESSTHKPNPLVGTMQRNSERANNGKISTLFSQ